MHHLISREWLMCENLYPLVDQLEQEMAAKMTCMLLEVGQTEIFHAREGSHVGGDLGSNEEVRDWINGLKKRFPPGHPKELSLWI
ncbi:hypothetical protein CK203_105095 [Vitis vinifera]|uniref:PABC domain-containing protein n=1 Tax=Vitis vinifera TaxID=29760 RepID=A0A438CNR2_VITVI|nr:hypothetical protein CK203_105095 [Vitis vinifera]